MFPARIHIGQIAVVFGIVIASTWSATQWTAAALGFQERLGAPWFSVAHPRVDGFMTALDRNAFG
jgi:type IV secretion system protein VirD4